MSHKRLATFSTTTSYQNLDTLMDAITGFTNGRVFKDGAFRVLATATNSVRISIVTDNQTTGSDGASALYAPGEYCPFTLLDANHVYIKSVGGTSTLEFEGDEF